MLVQKRVFAAPQCHVGNVNTLVDSFACEVQHTGLVLLVSLLSFML
jgi:hypothetical protein